MSELGHALAFIFVAALIPIIALSVSKIFRPFRPFSSKSIPYECGELPQGSAYAMFNHRFYLVAIAFLVFDVEVALLFPVMTLFKEAVQVGIGMRAFVVAFTFLFILFLGLVYEWKTGDLDWFSGKLEDPRLKPNEEKEVVPT